jgi:hypothetical protein
MLDDDDDDYDDDDDDFLRCRASLPSVTCVAGDDAAIPMAAAARGLFPSPSREAPASQARPGTGREMTSE